MTASFATEQDVNQKIDATFLPLKTTLSQNGAKRGPLWLAYHNLILFSRWGERLPTTEGDLKFTLSIDDPGRYAWFSKMKDAYTDLQGTSQYFNTNVYTAIGELTENLRQFAMDAKTGEDGTFNAIIDLMKADDKADALELVLALQQEATANAGRAVEVNKAIAKFASDLNIAEAALGRVNEEVEADGKTSQARIDQMQAGKDVEGSLAYYQEMAAASKKEYDHDVVVASTSPTYAWICPFGTIAAATVAGVYGKKATEALRAYKAAMTQIEAEEKELLIALKVRGAQKLAGTGLTKAQEHCKSALKESEVVQAAWNTINGDLEGVAQKLKAMTGTTDEGQKLKAKALVTLFAKQAGRKWAELMPMIEELASVSEGTTDLKATDPGAMADKIEAEMIAQKIAA